MRLSVLFLITIFACSRPCENGAVDLKKIIENPSITEYRGLRIVPYGRRENTTEYSTFINKDPYLFDNDSWKLLNTPEKVQDTSTSTKVEKIQRLFDLGVIALISDEDKTLIYTSFQDSTFNELKMMHPEYYDRYYDEKNENAAYRYVLLNIHSKNDSIKEATIRRFEKMSSVRPIQADWFYFRSQNYSSVCR